MTYDFSFGQWLVTRRKELHLQRTELATQIGCAAITLRKIECDERRPSQQLALLLAERLNLAPHHQALFVQVARGELPADRLSALQVAHTSSSITTTASQPGVRTPLPTNLPAPLTSFIGRDHDLDTLPALIHTHRLMTLTGVGGVGKTRLALEVGMRLVTAALDVRARDGVWLVELAALEQPTLVAQAIVRLFQIPEQAGRSSRELLQAYLAEKQLLLILDNCEHVIDVCAELAEYLLHHCWQVRILATSREPLRIPGELAYPVVPLTLPAADTHDPHQLLSTTAAQLFVARMGTYPSAHTRGRTSALSGDTITNAHHQPSPRTQAAIDHHDASAIAQICRQLDGIPLALELAAPLSHSMPLAEIASQLQNQMAILTNAYRTAIPRHQTMHSALVWSYRLLGPAEQVLLASMSVFAGGWTLEAAQAICVDDPPERTQLMLIDLMTKSLVLWEIIRGQRRYRLLEPVRQFARVQLQANGTEALVRRRHAAYFLALAEQMGPARDTPDERMWLERLEPERDNIRAVNQWAMTQGEAELAHRLNGALFAFWIYRSNLTEANHWYDLVLAIPDDTHDLVQANGAREAKANALNAAGYAAVLLPHYDSGRSRFEHELALRKEIGDPRGIAGALRGCSFVAMVTGNLDQAQQLSEQAIAISRTIDDYWGIAWSLYDLGYIALVRSDMATAQELLQQAIPQLRTQGINWGLYRALLAFGHVLYLTEQNNQARRYYHEALRLQQEMDYQQHVADSFEGLAGIAAAEHNPVQAAMLFGAAEAYRRATATPRWQPQQPWYDRGIALARSQLDPAQWEVAWQQGYEMSLDQAVAFALAGSKEDFKFAS